MVNTRQEMANRNKRQCRALVRRLQGTLMRLYCADRHLSVESRSFSPHNCRFLTWCACAAPLFVPPTPHGRSAAGWHRLGLGWLDGYCRCCRLRVLLFVPPLQRELKRGTYLSSLFSNNTKGPVPSEHRYTPI